MTGEGLRRMSRATPAPAPGELRGARGGGGGAPGAPPPSVRRAGVGAGTRDARALSRAPVVTAAAAGGASRP